MAELKTKKTNRKVEDFLDTIANEKMRGDSHAIVKIMKQVIGADPKMWGPSIIGFGDYHYKYESGRENDWFVAGFSPRKQNLVLYLMGGLSDEILAKLGKYKTGQSCLYIKTLADVDLKVLEKLIRHSVARLKGSTK
jgi:hypothetical protein